MTSGAPGVKYVSLEEGDAAPHFAQRGLSGDFNLFNLGGAPTVLAFVPSSSLGVGKAVLDIIGRHGGIFDGKTARFLALTVDRDDETRLKESPRFRESPGFQIILDFDGKAARRYGALPMAVPAGAARIQYRPRFFVLDKRLRVSAAIELAPDGSDAERIVPLLEDLAAAAEPDLTAPVLIVPRVFTPEFCRQLISLFENSTHQETGIVSQTGEQTTIVADPDFKRRRDCRIEDPQLISTVKEILRRRLLPEIAKAVQFQASHIERHIVSRYAAGEQGHFRAHRDNHSRGTAHRRFAATINLNREFEGGALSFPEFGARGFNAPPGGAMVFSCSLLHAVSVVTEGLRYAYLPFFYDEAGARILEANRASWTHEHLAPGAEALARF